MPLHVYKSRKRETITTLPLRPSQGRPQQAKQQQQQQQQKQQPPPQPPEQAASAAVVGLQPSRAPMRSSKMSPSPEFIAQEGTGKARSRRRRLVAPPARLLFWLASLSLLVLFANLSSSTHNQNHHRHHQRRRELENLLGNDIFGGSEGYPTSGGRSPEEQFAGPGQLELNAFVETRHVYKNNIPYSQEEEDEEDEQDKGNVRPVVKELDDDDAKLGPNSNPNTLNSDDHLDERTLEPEADLSNSHVPEQSPIVVSSSDNSYVSASPVAVEESTISSQATTRQSHQHHSHSLHTSQVNLTLQKAFLSGRHKSQEAPFKGYTTGGQRESLENNLSKGEPNIHHNHRHSYQHRRQPEAEEQTSKTRQTGVNSREHRQSIISDISTTATTTERSREPKIVHNTKGSSARQPAALSPRNTQYESHHSALRDSDTMEPNLVVVDSSGSDKFNKLAEVMESNNLEAKPEIADKYKIRRSTIIKTRESIQAGASYINYTTVTNLGACLVECWITDSCDTAIYQESPVDFNSQLPQNSPNLQQHHSLGTKIHAQAQTLTGSNEVPTSSDTHRGDEGVAEEEEEVEVEDEEKDAANNNNRGNEILNNEAAVVGRESRRRRQTDGFYTCYLFECLKPDGFKCQFSSHNSYVSAIKSEDTHKSELLQYELESQLPRDFFRTLKPQTSQDDKQQQQHERIDSNQFQIAGSSNEQEPLSRGFLQQHHAVEPKYSRIMQRRHLKFPSMNGRRKWHGTRVASIQIGEEEYKDYATGGLNSAIIASVIGLAATGMLILVVGHKMSSIRRRIAYKGRRRSIVPDKDFLINTLQA